MATSQAPSNRGHAKKFADPIDGDAVALVRPYLAAYEQQEKRCRELALEEADVLGSVWVQDVRVGVTR
ncbi:hypothetical protein [Streptomyces gobiensis]|uniref:hypothetical protein n=1 Tax=Streptomyces gobiensis TaxID=2875706 RepID=UPI001E6013EA|nr:hypothetical protein [Streptomyces gobiensis]UGY91750.1 hypothetical protein test1122_08460 [Streptomyces gobiensis]